jgi:hypothetical protein
LDCLTACSQRDQPLPSLDPADTARQLRRKFHFENMGGTNHDSWELVEDGRLIAYVDLARHKQPYRDKVIGYMAGQLQVQPRFFREMIQCTVTRKDFLASKGIVESPSPESDTSVALDPSVAPEPPTRAISRRVPPATPAP